MPRSVDQVLVHLVRHDDGVVPVGEFDDQLEGRAVQHRTGRVVRIVDQDNPGAIGDGAPELIVVRLEVRRPQQDGAMHPAAERDHGRVGVVERLERDDFVAVVHEREDGCGQRLGRPSGDENFAIRVDLDLVKALLVCGDRVPQHRIAESRRVLVHAVTDGLSGGLDHLGRAVLIRESLPEVDGPGRRGEAGHLREDGGPQQPVGAEQPRASCGARPSTGNGHRAILGIPSP